MMMLSPLLVLRLYLHLAILPLVCEGMEKVCLQNINVVFDESSQEPRRRPPNFVLTLLFSVISTTASTIYYLYYYNLLIGTTEHPLQSHRQ
jgi:hypothetical protein